MNSFLPGSGKVAIVALLALLAIHNSASAQDHAAKIDELIRLYYEGGRFNGSVLVAENGHIIYKKGIGPANMEWEIPNEPDTKFRIASMSKQFTALAIMQLQEAGLLSVSDPLNKYYPEYPRSDEISLHHMLTHSSGIPNANEARVPDALAFT